MIVRAGVMGDPVSQSLSPMLHGYWLKYYGIDGHYGRFQISENALEAALASLVSDGLSGVNLTIPHKEKALKFMDEVSEDALNIGAVNTVIIKKDRRLLGTNTDAKGFINNLIYHLGDLAPYLEHCFILGAGGAAKAVYYGLKQAGAKRISISNRNRPRAEKIGAQVVDWEKKDTALSDVSLLVNTTSLGMNGQSKLTLSLDMLPQKALVTDIVYNPLITPLLSQAKERGYTTVTGIGMLIHQAAPGFEAWFGQRPKIDQTVYDLLESTLS